MADTKISDDPAASALGGFELIPLLQSGVNKHGTPALLAAYIAARAAAGDVLEADEITLHRSGATLSIKSHGVGPAQLEVTGVTPGTYAAANITVGADGRITTAANGDAGGTGAAMRFLGAINCSGDPDYPAASAGHVYAVDVAGKIGGSAGIDTAVGDLLVCLNDSTPSGDQATVGSSWELVHTASVAVVGPAGSVDSHVAMFDGTTGRLLKDSGLELSGSNTGDQTITLTGDVTGSGTGSFAATLADSGVTAGSYTNASLTVDAKGRVTLASDGAGATASVDFKDSVELATTANITLSGEQTVDGTVTSGSRVLVKNQTTGSQNGIYVSGAGAWVRSDDADESAEVTTGMLVYVEGGSANVGSVFVLSTPAPIVLGTTALTFVPAVLPLNVFVGKTVSGTAYTHILTDASKRLNFTNAGTKTLTIAAQSTVNSAVNTEIEVFNAGAGSLTISGSLVTLNSLNGVATVPQYHCVKLKKRANPNTWDLTSVAVGSVSSVGITAPAAGITASGGPITSSGSITLALANDLAAVEGLSGTGIVRRTASDTWSAGTQVSTSEIADAAVTYAKLQNVSATSRVLGRKTAGSGVAEELTLSELLDYVGSAAQGDILYRGASTWARLAAGTAGQFLQTQGASANPAWASATSGTAGKHAVYVAAGSMRPSVTGGCASVTAIASASNQPDITTLDYDTTTEEYAQFGIVMPKSWNEGTITFQAHWSHAATTTNFGVAWKLQAVAVSDDDAIAVAFGTAVAVTDTGGTTNDLYTTSESSAITVAGSPAAGDMVFFRVYREPSNGSDTMAIDARLHGITVFMTTDAGNDA